MTQYRQNLIDNYIKGELSVEEKVEFDFLRKENENFDREVKEMEELIGAVEYHNEANALKQQLDVAHKDLEIYKFLHKSNRKEVKTYRLLATMGVAASISMIVVSAVLYLSGWFEYDENKHVQELRRLKGIVEKVENETSTQQTSLKEIEEYIKKQEASGKDVMQYRGTGFPISEDGYMLTSYHMVEGAQYIYVENKQDSVVRFRAKLVHFDAAYDLAVLKIDDYEFSSFGKIPFVLSAKEPSLGEYVYTLGYPKQEIVFGEGSISSLSGFDDDTISYQISIPANPGNSGGPLVNEKGELLGVIAGKSSAMDDATFAIKSDYIHKLISEMEADSISSVKLTGNNRLLYKKKTDQIKEWSKMVYRVKVYQ